MKRFVVVVTGAATKSVAMWNEAKMEYEFFQNSKDLRPYIASKAAANLNDMDVKTMPEAAAYIKSILRTVVY